MSANGLSDDARGRIEEAALRFIAAAFASLEEEHAIPPPRFQPFLEVGRDYFGPNLNVGREMTELDALLSEAFPERFAEPLKRRHSEFARTYIYSFLEAAVALCSIRGEPFRAESSAVSQALTSLIDRVSGTTTEVVCCRLVSHLTTATGEAIHFGDLEVVPQSEPRDYTEFSKRIFGAVGAFNRDDPFVWDEPHAIVVARISGTDPWELDHGGSMKIDRFLLLLRLLHAATSRSYYEVIGESSLVAKLRPRYVEHLGTNVMGAMVRRPVVLSESDSEPVGRLHELLESANVKREKMAATSWDVALRNFSRASSELSWTEQLIDLATALEAAISGKDKEDVTLRLRTRAAALLATDGDSGADVFRDVGILYGMRSNLVHGNSIEVKAVEKFARDLSRDPGTEMYGLAVAKAMDRARDIVRRAILARLCLGSGDEPVWAFTDESVPVDRILADDRGRQQWRELWRRTIAELGAASAADPAKPPLEWP